MRTYMWTLSRETEDKWKCILRGLLERSLEYKIYREKRDDTEKHEQYRHSVTSRDATRDCQLLRARGEHTEALWSCHW